MLKCRGCGVEIQFVDATSKGYINKVTYDKRLENNQSILCERCFRLKNYNEDLKIDGGKVPPIDESLVIAASDLKDYYDHIYTIKIDRIEVEYAGKKIDPEIQLSNLVCGTGFMLENGTFITDRQNVQPWIYSLNSVWKEPWRHMMAQFVACGANVVIHYRAYSTKGTGKSLSFVNTDFVTRNDGDMDATLRIERKVREIWEDEFDIEIDHRDEKRIAVISTTSRSYAYIRNLGTDGEGIPYDSEISANMSGGTELHMVGYAGETNTHDLTPAHFNDRTNKDDTQNGTIILQGQVDEPGYYGSPAFYRDEQGRYWVIGVMVGSVFGKDRLVPMKNIMN